MPFKDKQKRLDYAREYRSRNVEKVLEYEKKWRDANREKVRKKVSKWKLNNQDKVKEEARLYYLNNSEIVLERTKKYNKENRQKIREREKEYAKNNPEKVAKQIRNRYLKWKFGITLDDYNLMLEMQDGKCAICSSENNGETFSVDHDHKTNRVRGLLCDNCNTGIGMLQDDMNIIKKAIMYLRKHKK